MVSERTHAKHIDNNNNIRGIVNDWFVSYLSNRTQFVSLLGFNSNTLKIRHGVPQGSVLGPLLFLIYLNDLHKAIKFCKVYHFADDTNLLNISESPSKLQKQLNIDLKLLYKWLLANRISLNCTKTESIIFYKPGHKPSYNFKIKMNGHLVRPSEYIKYLGIYLDSTLSGKYQCDILTKKLKRANGMLCKIRHYVPTTELCSIYHAIFSSHMIYGSQVWGQSITIHTEKVFKLQNRAMRIISFSDFRAEVNPLYSSKGILKLEDHIRLQNCLFVYDFLNKNLPECFDDYFHKLNEIYTEDINTINSELGCLFTPYMSTARYGLQSITRQCIKSWNFFTRELNTDLSKLSRPNLKKKISSYFLDKYDPVNCHTNRNNIRNDGNNNNNINNVNNNNNNNNNNMNNNNNNNNNNMNNNNMNNNNNIDNIRYNRRFNQRWRQNVDNQPLASRWNQEATV